MEHSTPDPRPWSAGQRAERPAIPHAHRPFVRLLSPTEYAGIVAGGPEAMAQALLGYVYASAPQPASRPTAPVRPIASAPQASSSQPPSPISQPPPQAAPSQTPASQAPPPQTYVHKTLYTPTDLPDEEAEAAGSSPLRRPIQAKILFAAFALLMVSVAMGGALALLKLLTFGNLS